MPEPPTSGDPVDGLLVELCEHLGYCAALRSLDRSRAAALSVDALTEAILEAEGLVPALVPRNRRRRVRDVVARWLAP